MNKLQNFTDKLKLYGEKPQRKLFHKLWATTMVFILLLVLFFIFTN